MNERPHEQTFHLQCNSSINEIEYLEITLTFCQLGMYGVFTSPNTSQVRQEMSIYTYFSFNILSILHIKLALISKTVSEKIKYYI